MLEDPPAFVPVMFIKFSRDEARFKSAGGFANTGRGWYVPDKSKEI